MSIGWDTHTQEKFNQMIEKIPIFMRGIAQDKVSKSAEGIAAQNQRLLVCEKDMVDAFFKETPFGFHGPMKNDMKDLGIDYIKYGYEQ